MLASSCFLNIDHLLKTNEIKIINQKIAKVIKNHLFFQISKESDYENNLEIHKNIKESSVIMINQYEEENETENNKYYIIGFKRTLISIKQSSLNLIRKLLIICPNLTIYFMNNTKDYFSQNIKMQYKTLDSQTFESEITNFKENVVYFGFSRIFDQVLSCIAGYLINEGYMKTYENRIDKFKKREGMKFKTKLFYKDDLIFLRNITSSASSMCALYYHIEGGQLVLVKTNYTFDDKLIKREMKNYENINHPFIPTYYGIMKTKWKTSLVIEFINGQNIKEMDLNEDDKLKIIADLCLIFYYLHQKNYIYRDLKLNNVIVDKNKQIVLIDFDRMISRQSINDNENGIQDHTRYFDSDFIAPEIIQNDGFTPDKSDIYSLGKMILFIINQNEINLKRLQQINLLCLKCINKMPDNRPSIHDLILDFGLILTYDIEKENIIRKNKFLAKTIDVIIKRKYELGDIYEYVNKLIHYCSLAADQNHLNAQYELGIIYYKGKFTARDLNKAVYYLSLAADQNHIEAQLQLGLIYYKGEYVECDMEKTFYYLLLAANQNHPQAQNLIGVMYEKGQYVKCNISKAIHYFSLSANQNYCEAQWNLGLIYLTGEYIARDINKAIHYFSLASNQNYAQAQLILFEIYYTGDYIARDMNKAIHYLSLAADQNHPRAQFNLGVIYEKGEFLRRDINKAIHYYSLAANQNYSQAQFNLGVIYEKSKYVKHDISKAIFYYTLAANQNFPLAQFNLGFLYGVKNINKSIHFFLQAANRNFAMAQYIIGIYYFLGVYIKQDINKGISYICQAAFNGYEHANFSIGILLHDGKCIKQDIKKVIKYYKEASNFNNQYAKNNLGILFKNGFEKKFFNEISSIFLYFYRLLPQSTYPIAGVERSGSFIRSEVETPRCRGKTR